MNAWLASLGSDAVDAITDVVGIVAVVSALVLLVVVETRRSAGRERSKLLNRSALGVTVLALAIIGGRFQWIPAAGEGEGSGEVAASVSEPSDDSTSTTAVTTLDPDGPTSSLVGPPTPSSEPPVPSTIEDDENDPEVPTTLVGPPAPVGDESDDTPVDSEGVPGDDEVDTNEGPRGPPQPYEVAEGDNFWSIAESTLEAETGGPVSDAEIHGYWLELIDANVDQLVEPGNPDLILPGQVLDVPPVGGASP